MKKNDNITCRHPLSDKMIVEWRSWREWMIDWNQTYQARSLVGLLHAGFDVPCRPYRGPLEYGQEPLSEENARLIFYLSVADGWDEGIHRSFFHQIQSSIPYSELCLEQGECSIRTAIARKAFEMLCTGPFKHFAECGYGNYGKERERLFLSELFLPLLMNFFSEYQEEGIVVRNIPHDIEVPHNRKFAEKFLIRLIEAIWSWKENTFCDSMRPPAELEAKRLYDEQKRVRLADAKLWSLEILAKLKRLKILKDVKLQKEEEAKLEEIALRAWIYPPRVRNDRRVRTLEEALKVDDPTAWWLFKYRQMSIPEKPPGVKRRRRKVVRR